MQIGGIRLLADFDAMLLCHRRITQAARATGLLDLGGRLGT